MILKINCVDSKRIADILVSYSILDDMLCGYILEYNKLTNDKYFTEEAAKIKDDKSNLGMGDKMKCFCEVFPNMVDPDGKTIKNPKGKLYSLKAIRRQIAHDRRFSLRNGILIPGCEKNPVKTPPLKQLHKEFETNFRAFSSVFKAFYSDWDYREYFLYGIKKRGLYE